MSADVSTLLCQTVIEPWGARMRVGDNGTEQLPPDTRSEQEIAADIVRANVSPDPGDGRTPSDTDATLTAFVTATAPGWPTGPRTNLDSPGPVRSGRFA